MNTAKQKRPKAFCFGGDGVCFAWNIPSAPFYAACFTAIGFFYALTKNSPQDCFYLALLGTVAFESRRLFSPKQKTPEGVLFWRRRCMFCLEYPLCAVLCGVFHRHNIFYALPKNSPPDCFYLALLGTVAFESHRLFSPKQKTPEGVFVLAETVFVLLVISPPAPFFAACFTVITSSTLSLKTVRRTVFTSLCSARSPSNPTVSFRQNKKRPKAFLFWRRRWDSNPRYREVQLISSQSRYDHFDTSPYMRPISQALFNSF